MFKEKYLIFSSKGEMLGNKGLEGSMEKPDSSEKEKDLREQASKMTLEELEKKTQEVDEKLMIAKATLNDGKVTNEAELDSWLKEQELKGEKITTIGDVSGDIEEGTIEEVEKGSLDLDTSSKGGVKF